MPRSVCIHPDRRAEVAIALERNGFLTQGDLAAHLEIALSTVSNFCRGLKVSIAKYEQICETLGLDKKVTLTPVQIGSAPAKNDLAVSPTETFFALDGAWVGRQDLLADLVERVQGGCRLLLLTGIAGIGKTALAERLYVELRDRWLEDSNTRLVRQNCDDREQTADFATVAAGILEQCGQAISSDERQDSRQLLQRLVRYLQAHRTVVAIDSLEVVLQGSEAEGWSEFVDADYLRFVRTILSCSEFASCVVVTSQELPAQLLEVGSRYQNAWFCLPVSGLSESERLDLFEKTGLETQSLAAGRPLLARIGKAYEGHPLALRVIAGEIGSRPFYGNVLAYWDRYGGEIEEVEKVIAAAERGQVSSAEDRWKLDRFSRALRSHVRSRLGVTFERLKTDARYAYILLCEASVYRCPVPEDWWLSHLEDWDRDEAEQVVALETLRERYLVEEVVEGNRYLIKQHNLVRSVSLDCLEQLDGFSSG